MWSAAQATAHREADAHRPLHSLPGHCRGRSIHAALQRFHLALWRGEDHKPETVSDFYSEAFSALEKDEGPVGWTERQTRDKCREDGLRVSDLAPTDDTILTTDNRSARLGLNLLVTGLVPAERSQYSRSPSA